MAPEMSKNVKLSGDQDVTSQQRDQSGCGAGAGGAEEEQVPLPGQSSLLAMALDEIQSSLYENGLDFESINMDELMANVWKIEEFEAVNAACLASRQGAALMGAGGSGGGGGAEEGGLCQQESFSLPAPLSQNMMDELWAEINQEPVPAPAHAPSGPLLQSQPQLESGGVAANGQQATLGQMALNDFLAKAGMDEGSSSSQVHVPTGLIHGPMIPMQQQGQPAPMMFPVPPANAMYPVMGDAMGYHGGMPVVPPPPPPPFQGPLAEVSSGSSDGMSAMMQADMMNCIGSGSMTEKGARKRYAPEMDWYGDRSVELRHRRMVKNRESAARSRARRQAYTVELEAELCQLKEDNASLRAEEKTIQLAKKQMLVEKMMEQSTENVNAKKGGTLRRSGSCMW